MDIERGGEEDMVRGCLAPMVPRPSIGVRSRGRLDNILDAHDVRGVQGVVVDLVQRAGHLAVQLVL